MELRLVDWLLLARFLPCPIPGLICVFIVSKLVHVLPTVAIACIGLASTAQVIPAAHADWQPVRQLPRRLVPKPAACWLTSRHTHQLFISQSYTAPSNIGRFRREQTSRSVDPSNALSRRDEGERPAMNPKEVQADASVDRPGAHIPFVSSRRISRRRNSSTPTSGVRTLLLRLTPHQSSEAPSAHIGFYDCIWHRPVPVRHRHASLTTS